MRKQGRFDIDIIATGISHSQHERIRLLLNVVQRLCTESTDDSAVRGDIINEAEIQGIDREK